MDLSVPFVQQICKECGFDQREVERLSLSGEHIARLGKGLSGCQNVIVLDISRNLLNSLQGIEFPQHLRKLNIANNKISNIEELARLRHLPDLVDIDLRENPVCNKPDFDSVIISNVRKLRILNGETLSAAYVQRLRQQLATSQQRRSHETRKRTSTAGAQTEDDVLTLLNTETLPKGSSPERRATIPTEESAPQQAGNKPGLLLQALDQRIRVWETRFGLNGNGNGLDDSSSDEGRCMVTETTEGPHPSATNKHDNSKLQISRSPARMSVESSPIVITRESADSVLSTKLPIQASPPRSPDRSAHTGPRHTRTRSSSGSFCSAEQVSPSQPCNWQSTVSPVRERIEDPIPSTTRYSNGQDQHAESHTRTSADVMRQEVPKSVLDQMKLALDEVARDAITRMEAVASSISLPSTTLEQAHDFKQMTDLQIHHSQRIEGFDMQLQDIQQMVKGIATGLANSDERQRQESIELSKILPQVRDLSTSTNMKWQSCLDSICQLEQVICGQGGVVLSLQKTNDELTQRVTRLQAELDDAKAQHRSELQLLQEQFDELAATSQSADVTPTALTQSVPHPLAFPSAADWNKAASTNTASTQASGNKSFDHVNQPPATSTHILEQSRIAQQVKLDLKPL